MDVDLITQLAGGQSFGAGANLTNGLAQVSPDESTGEERHDKDSNSRVGEHAARTLREASVGAFERKIGVQHAENFLLLRMGVAGSVAAFRTILDRCDDAENASGAGA